MEVFMKKRIISLALSCIMGLAIMAGCSSETGGNTTTTAEPDEQKTEEKKDADGTVDTDKTTDKDTAELEPYTFSLYYSYDWWDMKPWGEDEASKFFSEKFNVNIEMSKPDADADAKLNIMISANELPDVIQMDRGPNHRRMAELDLLVDLAPLQAVNSDYDDNILPATQEQLKINGVLYSIPHWARKGPTGGNDSWMYNARLYEEAGSPELKTFEDLYDYAKYIKDNIPETQEGLLTIPFATQNNNDAHDKVVFAFYRSMGGPNKTDLYTARIDGKIQSVFRDPTYRKAALEANRWFRDGLISETQFSDTNDQMLEKFTNARTGLLYYDFSQDSINRFRQITMETYPGDSYELLTDPVYPPADGVSKIYADNKETVGWNILSITKQAENPQRIFDLLSYMLTKEGSIIMMYGPQGEWWDEMDSEGNPILKTPESELSTAEKDRIGSWFWGFCSHSDNVDLTKFAVNAMSPKDKQDFTITAQADVFTPIMFVTDEYAGINTLLDPLSEIGINRKTIDDQIKAELPKIIMASSEEAANKLFDELLAFMEANGLEEIEAAYDARHQELVATQGFTSYEDYK